MKIIVSTLLLLSSLCCAAQSVVWEKTECHNPIARFQPKGMAISPSGNVYVTGQYSHGDEYYKTVDGHTVLADTTMPDIGMFGCMFILKFGADGNLVKRQFAGGLASEFNKLKPEDFSKTDLMLPSVAEGSAMLVTNEQQLIITGFASGYRKKNYEEDRTQGVFAMLLDTNLLLHWDALYPSAYNSTPRKVIETDDGRFLIVACSHMKSVEISKYFAEDVMAARIIKISAKGKLLVDTLLSAIEQRDDRYDYFDTIFKHSYLSGEAISVMATDKGYLFSGTEKFRKEGMTHSSALLIETDQSFKPIRKKTYNLFEGSYSSYDFIGGPFAIGKESIAMTGLAQSATPPCYVAFLNKDTYDTLSVLRMEGDVFSYPGVVATGKNKYAVCVSDEKVLKIRFIENGHIVKTIDLKQQGNIDFVDMQVQGDHLYVLGNYNSGCYMAKVKLR